MRKVAIRQWQSRTSAIFFASHTRHPLPRCKRALPSLPNRLFSTAAISSDTLNNGSTSVAETPTTPNNPPNNTSTGFYRLLNAEQRQILREQRALVALVRKLARDVGLQPSNDMQQQSHPWLSTTGTDNNSSPKNSTANTILEESVFCIVLAGEFNAGKTTILNALLGSRVLETGALPTTDSITIVSAHPPPPGLSTSTLQYHQVPDSDLLQDLTLVDTPGTNAVLLDHTATTLRLLPSADLILFCTSADRPLSESERQLLANMATAYRKQMVVLINKMDLLTTTGGYEGAAEKQRVVDFVTEHVQPWLGAQPLVWPISAAQALAAKVNHPEDPSLSALWKHSQFAQLENFLRNSLTNTSKIQAKLRNPIGLAENLLDECVATLDRRRVDLHGDVVTLNLLESQVLAWQKELERQMQQTRQDVQQSWQQEASRGFVLLRRLTLSEYLQVTLLDATRLRRYWDETASLVTQLSWTDSQAVEAWIQETSEHLAVQSRAQGQALMEFLGSRPSQSRSNQSLVGHILAASRFEEFRETVTQQLHQAVDRHAMVKNHHEAVNQLLARLSQTTQASVALQMGGLSAALVTWALWLDAWVGLGAATALIGVGAAVLSQGRQAAVQTYSDQWTRRGKSLDEDLEQIGKQAIAKVQRRIQDGVAPYQNFITVEQQHIEDLESLCQEAQGTAKNLRKRINNL